MQSLLGRAFDASDVKLVQKNQYAAFMTATNSCLWITNKDPSERGTKVMSVGEKVCASAFVQVCAFVKICVFEFWERKEARTNAHK